LTVITVASEADALPDPNRPDVKSRGEEDTSGEMLDSSQGQESPLYHPEIRKLIEEAIVSQMCSHVASR
jgi:hypothetical protein